MKQTREVKDGHFSFTYRLDTHIIVGKHWWRDFCVLMGPLTWDEECKMSDSPNNSKCWYGWWLVTYWDGGKWRSRWNWRLDAKLSEMILEIKRYNPKGKSGYHWSQLGSSSNQYQMSVPSFNIHAMVVQGFQTGTRLLSQLTIRQTMPSPESQCWDVLIFFACGRSLLVTHEAIFPQQTL